MVFFPIGRLVQTGLIAWLFLAAAGTQAQAPRWDWVRPWQTPGHDGLIRGEVLARDREGNLYLSGQCQGTVALGDHWLKAEEPQAYVAKISPTGKCRWARLLPGGDTVRSRGESLAVDAQGNVWFSARKRAVAPLVFDGESQASLQPNFRSAPRPRHLIARLDSAGNWQWQRELRLLPGQESRVAVDKQGYAYVNGSVEAERSGLLATKLDAAGKPLWRLAQQAGRQERVHALAVTTEGQLYLAGSQQPELRVAGKQTARLDTARKGMVLQLHPDGRRSWVSISPALSAYRFLLLASDNSLFTLGQKEHPLIHRGQTRNFDRLGTRGSLLVAERLTPQGKRRWTAQAQAQGRYFPGPGLESESNLLVLGCSLGAGDELLLTLALTGRAVFGAAPRPLEVKTRGEDPELTRPVIARLSSAGRWRSAALAKLPMLLAREGTGSAALASVGSLNYLLHLTPAITQSENTFTSDDPELGVMQLTRLGDIETGQYTPLLTPDLGGSSHPGLSFHHQDSSLLVTGMFEGVLPPPGPVLHTPLGEKHHLVGVLSTAGSWRWRRALPNFPAIAIRKSLATPAGATLQLGYQRDGAMQLLQFSPEGTLRWLQAPGFTVPRESDFGYDGFNAVLALAGNGESWLAGSPAAGQSGAQLQHRDEAGRLRWQRELARGKLTHGRLVLVGEAVRYYLGYFAEPVTFLTRTGSVDLAPAQLGSTEAALAQLNADGTVESVRSLGALSLIDVLPAPDGGLWVSCALSSDSIRLPTLKGDVRFRTGDGKPNTLLARLHADGSWAWGKRVGEFIDDPLLSSEPGGRVLLHGRILPESYVSPATDSMGFLPTPQVVHFSRLGSGGELLEELAAPRLWPDQSVETAVSGKDGSIYLAGSFGINQRKGSAFTARLVPAAGRPPELRRLTSGRVRAGSWLPLEGQHLGRVSEVQIDGQPTAFEVISSTRLLVQIPARVSGKKVLLRLLSQDGSVSASRPLRIR